jgi:hypothetical protein
MYYPEHMCHDSYTSTYESSVLPSYVHVNVPKSTHHHSMQAEVYRIWVANRYEVRQFVVSKETYRNYRTGNKISMKD